MRGAGKTDTTSSHNLDADEAEGSATQVSPHERDLPAGWLAPGHGWDGPFPRRPDSAARTPHPESATSSCGGGTASSASRRPSSAPASSRGRSQDRALKPGCTAWNLDPSFASRVLGSMPCWALLRSIASRSGAGVVVVVVMDGSAPTWKRGRRALRRSDRRRRDGNGRLLGPGRARSHDTVTQMIRRKADLVA
jgi:hypothetical protein